MAKEDNAGRIGTYANIAIGNEIVSAYVPQPLPPEPPLRLTGLLGPMEEANRALGRLDGITSILPEIHLFLYMYNRKEAVLSSQIEGTQSSLSELLLFEFDAAPGAPFNDVQEVSNYVKAMEHGISRLQGGFPLSLRLIREVHEILMKGSRGGTKQPGEFRQSQNWIGGSRPGNATFVPPPPDKVPDCMANLESYFHQGSPSTPLLIKAALVHVQFETIHPFLDGNGRIGRLLITLLLCSEGALVQSTLYLSLYLKRNRQLYYELLQEVREQGTWENWLEFFMTGVKETSEQAASAARQILDLFKTDRAQIENLGRKAGSVLRVQEYLQARPLGSVPDISKKLELSQPTVRKAMEHLQTLGIVYEATGKRRGQLFAYGSYLSILSEGTEPLQP